MTKEEKQILLKDLCMRLPYGVKATTTSNVWKEVYTITGYANNRIYLDCPVYDEGDDEWLVEFVKPYLRPMSSMTKEEHDEYIMIEYSINAGMTAKRDFTKWIDFVHSHHFDYRGLIEKGLALPAPEGMYDFK